VIPRCQLIPIISSDPSVTVINFCRTPSWIVPRVRILQQYCPKDPLTENLIAPKILHRQSEMDIFERSVCFAYLPKLSMGIRGSLASFCVKYRLTSGNIRAIAFTCFSNPSDCEEKRRLSVRNIIFSLFNLDLSYS
jgi:hypothetical protein